MKIFFITTFFSFSLLVGQQVSLSDIQKLSEVKLEETDLSSASEVDPEIKNDKVTTLATPVSIIETETETEEDIFLVTATLIKT